MASGRVTAVVARDPAAWGHRRLGDATAHHGLGAPGVDQRTGARPCRGGDPHRVGRRGRPRLDEHRAMPSGPAPRPSWSSVSGSVPRTGRRECLCGGRGPADLRVPASHPGPSTVVRRRDRRAGRPVLRRPGLRGVAGQGDRSPEPIRTRSASSRSSAGSPGTSTTTPTPSSSAGTASAPPEPSRSSSAGQADSSSRRTRSCCGPPWPSPARDGGSPATDGSSGHRRRRRPPPRRGADPRRRATVGEPAAVTTGR